MAQTKNYRKKGTGSIYKHGKQFYLKIRINHKTKTILLRDQNDQPVTNRHDAEKAANRHQPCLLARQKEEIALYVSDARQMKSKASQSVASLWSLYLQSGRSRDIAPGTLHNNQYIVTSFLSWMQKEHPEKRCPGMHGTGSNISWPKPGSPIPLPRYKDGKVRRKVSRHKAR